MPKRALAAFVLSGLLLIPVTARSSIEERRTFVGSVNEAIEADPGVYGSRWQGCGTTDLPANLVQLEIDHLLRMARMDGRDIPDWEWSHSDTHHGLIIEVDDNCLQVEIFEDCGRVAVMMPGPMTCEYLEPGPGHTQIFITARSTGYPELATVAGIEARVVLERLPSPPGESPVLRVRSTSSENMGFEQSAMASVEVYPGTMKSSGTPHLFVVWFLQDGSPRCGECP